MDQVYGWQIVECLSLHAGFYFWKSGKCRSNDIKINQKNHKFAIKFGIAEKETRRLYKPIDWDNIEIAFKAIWWTRNESKTAIINE